MNKYINHLKMQINELSEVIPVHGNFTYKIHPDVNNKVGTFIEIFGNYFSILKNIPATPLMFCWQ